MLGDVQIRDQLNKDLTKRFSKDVDALMVHELTVCQGNARIDIAVINGSINGFEIKSDKDTIERLPNQASIYDKVFDTMTLVVGSVLYLDALKIIPPWWGVTIAKKHQGGKLILVEDRPPTWNRNVDSVSLLRFLWKDELVDLLQAEGENKRVKYKTCFELWHQIADTLPLEHIQAYVRSYLKRRPPTWRPDALRMSSDGWYSGTPSLSYHRDCSP